MVEIRIESKLVPWTNGYEHAYLVFVTDAGNEFVIRGGPESDIPFAWGDIVVESGLPMVPGLGETASEDYRSIFDRDDFRSTVLDLNGRDASAVWYAMLQAVDTVGDAGFSYDYFGTTQNSNSVVSSVLARLGISWTDYSFTVSAANNVGIENELADTSYRLIASSLPAILNHADEFHGGNLNDLLVGGRGADALYGSNGADTLVGGRAIVLADGTIQSTTADGKSDLLNGGIGEDKYYVNTEFVLNQYVVKGKEAQLALKVDLIRDEDGLGTVYDGNEIIDFSGVVLRPNSTSFYGDFLDSASESTVRFGGKIVGNEIIYGFFDRSGFESYVFFKTDIDVSLPQAGPPGLLNFNDEAGLSISTLSGGITGSFLGITFASALNQIEGTAVSNTLSGTTARDYVKGLAGSDTINGFEGSDVIDGGDGDDMVNGNDGNDDIIGENGHDQLLGDEGDDWLDGGSGNDLLNGGTGNDHLSGGVGADIYVVDSVFDIVDARGEELYFDEVDWIYSSVTFSIVEEGIEGLTLTGTDAINCTGNAGANTLTGNSGNNQLDGAGGDDTLIGGFGNDKYVIDSNSDIVDESLSAGIDVILSNISIGLLAANVENLTLTGNAAINGTGNSLNNSLIGNNANNTLNGGAGHDRLNGGLGIDSLIGGVGNDTYTIDSTTDTIIEDMAGGTDTLLSSVSVAVLSANLERLTLTGTASISGIGNALNNNLIGNAGNNVLNGNLGNDELSGGAGKDSFVFSAILNASTNIDEITDFVAVDDTIRLQNDGAGRFTTLADGVLDATAFASNATGVAMDVDDRIIYNGITGALFYDADGTGAIAAIQFAVLTATPTITATDFLVV